MAGKDIQAAIHRALTAQFDADLVASEWSVRRGAADTFDDAASYAPRIDVAVGPFNSTLQNRGQDAAAIRGFHHPLVELLTQIVLDQNGGAFYRNHNPRCLIAIEVENNTSSKHILGAITNVSMLGLLGVVVGSAERVAKVRRIHAYACKLKEVGKAHDDLFGNVACFEENEFRKLLRQARRTRQVRR